MRHCRASGGTNLKLALVVVVLLSAAVFTGGVALERAAEPGAAETVLGINPESPRLVTAAIVLTLLLAAAIWLRPASLTLAAAGAFGLVFAFFDTLEIWHQFQEHRPSLSAIAATAALCHLAVTALAVGLIRETAVSNSGVTAGRLRD